MAEPAHPCQWISLSDALRAFVYPTGPHQSQAHIRPLHWYAACRLVVEGGFHPDEITPRPPFAVSGRGRRLLLTLNPDRGGSGERTILGGLKTKDVDVAVAKPEVGPCLVVSIKGTLKAFRNLTNRMEEAVGDCTNLHIAYPNLVYGFFHVLRANKEGPCRDEDLGLLTRDRHGRVATSDVALRMDGGVAEPIRRYHRVLRGLTGRLGIRNDFTRYEALALAMVHPSTASIASDWPPNGSPLRFGDFFRRIYRE